jgi:hypothetical protein
VSEHVRNPTRVYFQLCRVTFGLVEAELTHFSHYAIEMLRRYYRNQAGFKNEFSKAKYLG